jgi:hypothetical protein
MPFPLPGEWGATAGSPVGTANYFVPQPNDYRMLRAPRIPRGDGGVVQDGLDGIQLIWNRMTQDQYNVLVQHYGSAAGTALGGLYHFRLWIEESAAYADRKCSPRPPRGSVNQTGQFYVRVEWDVMTIGIS